MDFLYTCATLKSHTLLSVKSMTKYYDAKCATIIDIK
jgi:hypothetical protein